ncbi:MAG: hypothetical protein ITG01_12000 [Comamonas sp.]|nr:hypothetical protein [Comamonas sp.]
MNAVTTPADTSAAPPVTMGFGDLASFEFLQRSAKAFASSTMVPTAYQNMVTKGYGQRATVEPNPSAVPNCMIALDMAQRMNANPLMIMQNLHIIEGRPSWSSQFIIAAINNCGKFSPLRFDLEWLEEVDATYSTFEWSNGQKTEKKHKARVKNARCIAWAIEKATGERLESAPVTMEMAVNEGWYGKNGSKWRSMPDLMLRYRSAAFFGRIYAPELLMGLPTAEEMQDVFVQEPDGTVTHAGPQAVPKSMGTAEVVKPPYDQAKFDKGLGNWAKAIADGIKTRDDTLAWLNSVAPLSKEQIEQLDAAVQELVPVEVKQKQPDAPQVDPDKLAADMQSCADLDKLYELGSLIDAVADQDQQANLSQIFDARVAELEQAP